MDYQLLSVDPLAAHKDMALHDGIRDLFDFVRKIAMNYSIALVVFPKWEKHVDRWKMVAKTLSDNVLFNPPTGITDKKIAYVSMNKYKAHFRSACLVHRGEDEFIRLGCLVNKERLDNNEVNGFQKLVDEYNNRVVSKYEDSYEFMSMSEWMESRGVLV